MSADVKDCEVVESLHVREKGRVLRVKFSDGRRYDLTAEYLRVMTPSAEARGHGKETRKIVSGKRHVRITALHPVGHYAIRPIFDDGHDSGLFRWAFLRALGTDHAHLWAEYLQELEMNGLDRD